MILSLVVKLFVLLLVFIGGSHGIKNVKLTKMGRESVLRRYSASFQGSGRIQAVPSIHLNQMVATNMQPPQLNRIVPSMPHELTPQQFVYVVLSTLFVTCLIIADVVGVKLFNIPLPFSIGGYTAIEHTCGMLTFPITFLLGDIINEYYGAKAAKNTVYIGLVMSILVFVVMNIAQALPYLDKPFNVTKTSFDMIFGSAKLMYIASVVAYLLGSLSDIWLFCVIKKLTKGKYLWLRATGSTVISQLLDSFVVSYIAFALGKTLIGQPPASIPEVLNIAVTGYGLKLVLATALTPFLYALKYMLSTQYGLQPIPCDACDDI